MAEGSLERVAISFQGFFEFCECERILCREEPAQMHGSLYIISRMLSW